MQAANPSASQNSFFVIVSFVVMGLLYHVKAIQQWKFDFDQIAKIIHHKH